MGPMRVVVQRVFADHVFEVAAADNQQPVEALAANTSDPALGVRFRLRRPHRRLDDTDSFRAEDLIKSRVNLLSRSRIKNCGQMPSSSSCISRLRACWVALRAGHTTHS
jgi:hypothetical protein